MEKGVQILFNSDRIRRERRRCQDITAFDNNRPESTRRLLRRRYEVRPCHCQSLMDILVREKICLIHALSSSLIIRQMDKQLMNMLRN